MHTDSLLIPVNKQHLVRSYASHSRIAARIYVLSVYIHLHMPRQELLVKVKAAVEARQSFTAFNATYAMP